VMWGVLRYFPVALCRSLVGVSQLRPFVHASPAKNSHTLDEKGRIFDLPWIDLDPYPMVGTFIIDLVLIRSYSRNLE